MLTSEIRDALTTLYARVEEQTSTMGSVCLASGRCCRFKEYGHTLFLSEIEAERLLEEGIPESASVSDESCPFQVNGLCMAREKRPLGCRVYYCDPTTQERQHQLTESFIRELKALHEAHGRPWNYRPLHDFLHGLAAGRTSSASANPLIVLGEMS